MQAKNKNITLVSREKVKPLIKGKGGIKKMAYQPLYATVSDKNTTKSTTSTRGLIDCVYCWINSELGDVVKIHASIDDRQSGIKTVNYNYNQLYHWQKKLKQEDLTGKEKIVITKKIKQWQKRLEEAKTREKSRKVKLSIDLGKINPEQVDLTLFGVHLTPEKWKIFKNMLSTFNIK